MAIFGHWSLVIGYFVYFPTSNIQHPTSNIQHLANFIINIFFELNRNVSIFKHTIKFNNPLKTHLIWIRIGPYLNRFHFTFIKNQILCLQRDLSQLFYSY